MLNPLLGEWRLGLSIIATVLITSITGRIAHGQVAYQRLWSLGGTMNQGQYSDAVLIEATNGMLYGVTRYGGLVNHYPGGAGVLFTTDKDGHGFRVLHYFGNASDDGLEPYGGLVFGKDGTLFGTTEIGGAFGWGTVYKIAVDGTGYAVLKHFSGGADAGGPRCQLITGSNSWLYGVTMYGGSASNGVIFRIAPDGNYEVLHSFRASMPDGRAPTRGLIKASDGILYGMALGDPLVKPTNIFGTIYRIHEDGSAYETLHTFLGTNALDGAFPGGRLLEGSDGILYGTTQFGGLPGGDIFDGYGTIFKLNKDGTGYKILRRMNSAIGDPLSPYDDLIQGSDGAIYGLAADTNIFRINRDGSGLAIVRTPTDALGRIIEPAGGLLRASDGLLYGATRYGGYPLSGYGNGVVFRMREDGSEYTNIVSFPGPSPAIKTPRTSLLRARDGLLYGTGESGGSSNAGAIFRLGLNPLDLTVLLSFGSTAWDGKTPNNLVEGADGQLYGTTRAGGTNNAGTLFRIDKNGSGYLVLRNFGLAPDGTVPLTLTAGRDGLLYGGTYSGGTSGRGIVFKVNRNGNDYTIIRSLAPSPDGSQCVGVLEGNDGMLYCVTTSGGSAGRGIVFRLNKDGSGYQLLHTFVAGVDGASPLAGLIEGPDDTLYGTTSTGPSGAVGTVYRIAPDGSQYSVLNRFASSSTDARVPYGGLVLQDGILFGTTFRGGVSNLGTVYQINTDGSDYRVLRSFTNGKDDGSMPSAGLTLSDGILFGTTEVGGDFGLGTLFRLDPRSVSMQIVRQMGGVLARWPLTSTSDSLMGTASLGVSNVSWAPVKADLSTNGSQVQAVIPVNQTSQFLRVRRDWR